MLRAMEILFAQQKQFRIHLQFLFDVSKRIVVGLQVGGVNSDSMPRFRHFLIL